MGESPSNDEVFLRLGYLIFNRGVPIGVIATAIERQGVHTWDRYGRRLPFPPGSPEATRALDLLAAAHQALGESESIFDWEDFSHFGGDAFGWPEAQAPDFNNLAAGMQEQLAAQPPRHSVAKVENASVVIIGGLLKYIKGELGNSRHPDFSSEEQLTDVLEEKLRGYPGASKRNLKDKFARAKEALM